MRYEVTETSWNPYYGPKWMVWDNDLDRHVQNYVHRNDAVRKARKLNNAEKGKIKFADMESQIYKLIVKGLKRFGKETMRESLDICLETAIELQETI